MYHLLVVAFIEKRILLTSKHSCMCVRDLFWLVVVKGCSVVDLYYGLVHLRLINVFK